MAMKSVCSCVLILSLQFVCGQYSTSPCPDIFNFEDDGHHVYGKIILQPVAPVASLVVRINFTVAAQLFNSYVGRIDAHDSNHLLQRYNRGQPVSYLVHFPVTSPLPKLTAITVNGDVICYGPGDIPTPLSYVTTLSLQHKAFLQSGPIQNNVQQAPHPHEPAHTHTHTHGPTVDHVHFGDDDSSAHIYTFNNVEPTFNSGNIIVNNTRPFTQPTQQYQPQTPQVVHSRPIYEFIIPYEDTTRRPVTSRPIPPMYETAVTRPNQDNILYISDEPITLPRPVAPRPVVSRPAVPRPAVPRPVPVPVPVPSPDPVENYSDNAIECGVLAGGDLVVPLIYHGRAYVRGEIPWLVAIYKRDEASLQFICGGTLVSDRHVITAAHCMQRRGERTSVKDIVVKVGVHNLNDWSDDITVTRSLLAATIHESFNLTTLENDILTLTLNKRVKFNAYIRPACLWGDNTDLSLIVGTSGVVAGWGDQGVGGIGKQGEPHMVRIPIVSTTDCRASNPDFHRITYDTTFCAGDRKGSGPCIGDSGGGMTLKTDGKWRLRGIVSVSLSPSNGDNTCNLNEYVIFTDTAQYLTWIRRILAENYYD